MLLFLAILPTVVLVTYVYRKDKIEKEPASLLWNLFFLGALTVVSAIVIGALGDFLFEDIADPDSLAWLAIDNFLLTALVEEGGKYFVLKKRTWKSPEFDYVFDAVVYAVVVSLGFATLENILYVMDGGLETAIMRALLSVPGHAIDGVFMGCFYGMAKRHDAAGNKRGRKKNLRRALWAPTLIHGFYDFCLSVEDDGTFIMIFFVFEIIVTVWAFRKVRKMSREDAPVA